MATGASVPGSSTLPTLAVLEQPLELDFHELSYSVTAKGTRQQLQILSSVSGACRAGRLTACLGPSGAGKSTLVCACRAQQPP